jgi:hypothetical protein
LKQVEKTFTKTDILGRWEVCVVYEFEFIKQPDYIGWIFSDYRAEFFLNGEPIMPADMDEDDLKDLTRLIEVGKPQASRL